MCFCNFNRTLLRDTMREKIQINEEEKLIYCTHPDTTSPSHLQMPSAPFPQFRELPCQLLPVPSTSTSSFILRTRYEQQSCLLTGKTQWNSCVVIGAVEFSLPTVSYFSSLMSSSLVVIFGVSFLQVLTLFGEVNLDDARDYTSSVWLLWVLLANCFACSWC